MNNQKKNKLKIKKIITKKEEVKEKQTTTSNIIHSGSMRTEGLYKNIIQTKSIHNYKPCSKLVVIQSRHKHGEIHIIDGSSNGETGTVECNTRTHFANKSGQLLCVLGRNIIGPHHDKTECNLCEKDGIVNPGEVGIFIHAKDVDRAIIRDHAYFNNIVYLVSVLNINFRFWMVCDRLSINWWFYRHYGTALKWKAIENNNINSFNTLESQQNMSLGKLTNMCIDIQLNKPSPILGERFKKLFYQEFQWTGCCVYKLNRPVNDILKGGSMMINKIGKGAPSSLYEHLKKLIIDKPSLYTNVHNKLRIYYLRELAFGKKRTIPKEMYFTLIRGINYQSMTAFDAYVLGLYKTGKITKDVYKILTEYQITRSVIDKLLTEQKIDISLSRNLILNIKLNSQENSIYIPEMHGNYYYLVTPVYKSFPFSRNWIFTWDHQVNWSSYYKKKNSVSNHIGYSNVIYCYIAEKDMKRWPIDVNGTCDRDGIQKIF